MKEKQSLLKCPFCHADLRYFSNKYYCTQCQISYPIIDGIVDFYPEKREFEPAHISIKDQYEKFGKKTSRNNHFQNVRRKKLTLELIEGKNLLEIGSAEGWMTEQLVRKSESVVSCDISLHYLKRAKAEGINTVFIRLDSHYLPFSDSYFDCVVITEVLEHLYSPYRALEEIYRVMKPNGILVISVPNQMNNVNIVHHLFNIQTRISDGHLNTYDIFSIQNLLKFVGFSIETVKTSFVHVPGLKCVFSFHFVQNILSRVFRNFGDKIIIKARKTNQTLWNSII